MRLKIHRGTVTNGGPSLCESCRWATIVRGAKLSDEIVSCSKLSDGRDRITFSVAACSGFSDRRLTSLHDMEEIAWVLRSDKRGKHIGFVRARDLKPAERYVLDEDDWT